MDLNVMMEECNNFILSTGIQEPFTTYCITVVNNDDERQVVYSYMGDSRIYIITKQFIEQISVDDKLSYANVVTKCLGMNTLENYDFRQNTINITDENLLLCTDGFYHFLENDRMKFFDILHKKNTSSIKDELNSIVANNNKDDATFVLIR